MPPPPWPMTRAYPTLPAQTRKFAVDICIWQRLSSLALIRVILVIGLHCRETASLDLGSQSY
eukprot:scaffold68973_cov14-Prasinocladus_malaysianus.AAC.1